MARRPCTPLAMLETFSEKIALPLALDNNYSGFTEELYGVNRILVVYLYRYDRYRPVSDLGLA